MAKFPERFYFISFSGSMLDKPMESVRLTVELLPRVSGNSKCRELSRPKSVVNFIYMLELRKGIPCFCKQKTWKRNHYLNQYNLVYGLEYFWEDMGLLSSE